MKIIDYVYNKVIIIIKGIKFVIDVVTWIDGAALNA